MTKAEKKFNELLHQYLEAYQAANGRSFGCNIIYRSGYVIECAGERGFRERLGTFEKMLNTLKKRISQTTVATPIDKDLELPTCTKYFQTETKSITVFDSGDPTVGIPATQFTLGSNFYFDEPEHLEDFKRDLMKLLGDHGQTQGRTSALTDWELEAMQNEVNEDFAMDYSKDFEDEIMCSDCGSDNLAYIEQYANGCEYQCRDCDKTSIY